MKLDIKLSCFFFLIKASFEYETNSNISQSQCLDLEIQNNDADFEKEMLKKLIDTKDNFQFKNSKNNVLISNTDRIDSKTCNLS